MNVLAKMGITISSTDDKVVISSLKEVQITGGSSQITLNGSGIFQKTGGKFEVKAGQHVFQGGASVSAKSSLPPPPKRAQGILELIHDYTHGEFVKAGEYTVTDTLGKVVKGKLDDKGFARPRGRAQQARRRRLAQQGALHALDQATLKFFRLHCRALRWHGNGVHGPRGQRGGHGAHAASPGVVVADSGAGAGAATAPVGAGALAWGLTCPFSNASVSE